MRALVWLVLPTVLAGCSCGGDTGPKRVSRSRVHLRPNRLYSGAPPVIPHQVRELGREECLDCHLEGEAMDEGKRAPVVPHPELERCQQCHVERRTAGVFRGTTFVGAAYRRGRRQQPKGPWLIPHPLTLRENCLGCHGPSSTEPWLRTTHPERTRCRQCHLPAAQDWPGPRPRQTTLQGPWSGGET